MTDPLTTVRGFYDRLKEGALDFETLDPEIRWRTPASLPWTPKGQSVRDGCVEYRGLEELGHYLQAVVEQVEGMVAKADTFLADGNRVVVLGRECGTARNTGKPFAAPFAHVLTVEDGKITELLGHIDTALLATAFEDQTTN